MNWSDAVQILKSFRNQRVLVVGDVMLEPVLVGDRDSRVARSAPSPLPSNAPVAYARGVYDVTGAGDAVIATLALALVANGNLSRQSGCGPRG